MTHPETSEHAALTQLTSSGMGRRSVLKGALAVGVTAMAASQFLAACAEDEGGDSPDVGKPRPGGTFREGYDRDLTPPDPVKNAWADPTFNAFYEALVVRNPEGSPVPMLASEFASSATGWQFTLRDGLSFHSGAAVTAAVVAANFEIFRGAETGQNAPFWRPITEVKHEGSEIELVTEGDFRAFQETVTTEYSYILNLDAREEAGDQYGASSIDGTGPFELVSFAPGQGCTAKRWEDYPGSIVPFFQNKGKAYLDEISWVPITQASQRAAELESGNVDAIKNPPPQDVERLKSNSDLTVVEFQEQSNFFLSLNLGNTELDFDDVRVRQAISHAIDREGLVASIYQGQAAATYGPFMPGFKWFNPAVEELNQYDPDRAAELLDEAGWEVGSDGIREKDGTRMSFTTLQLADATEQNVMQALVEMLKEVGVEMEVEALEAAAFFPQLSNETLSYAFKWLWSSPVDVAALFVEFYQPADAESAVAVAEAYTEWQTASSEEDLQAAAENFQSVFAELLPLLPLLTPNTIWASNKKVVGWQPNQINLYPFYNDVWLNE